MVLVGCSNKDGGKTYYLKQTVPTKYFEVTVNEVLETTVVNPNGLDKLVAQPGTKYFLINVTIKNISSESRIFDSGELHISINGKDLKYDKSEIVFAKGYINFGNINPLISETGYLVFNVPETVDARNNPYWIPARSNDKIFILQEQPKQEEKSTENKIDEENISKAVKVLVKGYRKDGMLGASQIVSNCYDEYSKISDTAPSKYRKFEYCVSLDLAGYRIDDDVSKASKFPANEYFELNAVTDRIDKNNKWSYFNDRIEGMVSQINQDTRISLQEIQ